MTEVMAKRQESENAGVGFMGDVSGAQEQHPKRCPFCDGTGWITWEDENGYLFGKECKCRIASRQLFRLEQSGLSLVTEKTMDAFKAEEAWQLRMKAGAEKYLANEATKDTFPAPWFFVGGQVGCGKTHICTAICLELIERGHEVLYKVWATMAAELKAARNTDDFSRMMDKLHRIEVLYIDDFFKGNVTEADKLLAWEIINGRYLAAKRTIISSELHNRAILVLDEATGSRITQMAKGFIHSVNYDFERNQRVCAVG